MRKELKKRLWTFLLLPFLGFFWIYPANAIHLKPDPTLVADFTSAKVVYRILYFCPRHKEYFDNDHFGGSWLCRRARDKFIQKQREKFDAENTKLAGKRER